MRLSRGVRRWVRRRPRTPRLTRTGSRRVSRARRQVRPLESALVDLRTAVLPIALPLPLPGAAEQRRSIREITSQLDDYVLPRLATIDAPLLAVVGARPARASRHRELIGRSTSERAWRHPDRLRGRLSWSITALMPSGSATTGFCQGWPARPVRAIPPDHCNWSRTTRSRRGSRFSMHQISTSVVGEPRAGSSAAGCRRSVALRHLGRSLCRCRALGLPQFSR